MGTAWVIGRAEVRQRRWALLGLAALVALGSAVTLGALAGARRTSSSVDRLMSDARGADVLVLVGNDEADTAAAEISGMAEVRAAAAATVLFAIVDGIEADLGILAARDEQFGSSVEAGLLLRGRRAASGALDEVVANERAARLTGIDVGDQLQIRTLSPEQVESESYFPPEGPVLDVEVVGVVRSVDGLSEPGNPGFLAPPALLPAVEGEVDQFASYVGVTLEDGVPAEAFTGALQTRTGFEDVEVELRADELRGEQETVHALGVGLGVVGAVSAAASAMVLGQAVARHVASSRDTDATLQALGMPGRRRRLVRAAGVAPAVAAGTVVGAVCAFLSSSRMPIGLARRAEPDPGLAADRLVLAGGSAVFVVCLLGVAYLSGTRQLVVGFGGSRRRGLLGSNAGPVAAVGATFARGGGRPALPVRSSLVALTVGLAGCLTAAAFVASTDSLLSSPERWGHDWDLLLNFTSDTVDGGAARISEDERFAAAARLDGGVTVLDGEVLNAFGMSPIAGDMTYALRSGRQPVGPREGVVGVSVAEERDIELGDTLVLGADDRIQELTVVGTALFPDLDGEQDLDDGIGLDGAGFAAVGQVAEEFNANQVVVRLRPEDRQLTDEEIERDYPGSVAGPESRPAAPGVVANIGTVRPLAVWSGFFLALLAAGSLAHVLQVTVRRRRTDLGTLRAIGFTSRQLRSTIAAQSGLLTVPSLPLSLALGYGASAALWELVAGPAHAGAFVERPLGPWALICAGAALIATVVTIAPARSAARRRLRAGAHGSAER